MTLRPASPSEYTEAVLAAFDGEEDDFRPPSPRTPQPPVSILGPEEKGTPRTPRTPGTPSTIDLSSTPPPPLDLPAVALSAAASTPSSSGLSRCPPVIPLSQQRRIQSTATRKANKGQRHKYRKAFPPWKCVPCGVVCVDRTSKEIHVKTKKHSLKVNYTPQTCSACSYTAYHPNDFSRHINGARHKRRIGQK